MKAKDEFNNFLKNMFLKLPQIHRETVFYDIKLES